MAHTQATLVASVAMQHTADEISEGSSQANGAKRSQKEPKGAKRKPIVAKETQMEPKGPRRSHLDQRELKTRSCSFKLETCTNKGE